MRKLPRRNSIAASIRHVLLPYLGINVETVVVYIL